MAKFILAAFAFQAASMSVQEFSVPETPFSMKANSAMSAATVTAATENAAIRDLLERRRVVWNSRNADAYRALLTDDFEQTSATGRTARGVDEALRLYAEQQRSASYLDAIITATIVHDVRMLDATNAEVDASYEMTGVRIPENSDPRAITGNIVFTVRKQADGWKIAALRAAPPR